MTAPVDEVQLPEGLRKVALDAAYEAHRAGKFTVSEITDAALAAVVDACSVRDYWVVKHINPKGRSTWSRIFGHHNEAADVEANNRPVAEREGDRSVLLQKVVLSWTQPVPPAPAAGDQLAQGEDRD